VGKNRDYGSEEPRHWEGDEANKGKEKTGGSEGLRPPLKRDTDSCVG